MDFTDFGSGSTAALSTTAVVNLRSRTIEAEAADEFIGPKVMEDGSASGKKMIGQAGRDHVVKISGISLLDVSKVAIRYALREGEQHIDIRKGAKDGEKIGEIILKSTGDWGKFQETQGQITSTDETADLYFVLSSAMNLDWFRFDK